MHTITEFAISEDELLTSLEHDIASCDNSESEIKKIREQSYQYYYGKTLGNELEGRSQHVSMDVFEMVQSVKAMVLNSFKDNRDICHFDDSAGRDAEIDNALANEIFYRQNEGTKILHDVVHDALLTKLGVVKVYYKTDYEYEEEEFEGLDEASFNLLGAEANVYIQDVKKQSTMVAAQDMQTGESIEVEQTSYSGSITRQIDTSKVCIEVIPPENIFVDQRATSIKDAEMFSLKQSRTKGDLLADGFPREKVDRLDEEIEQNYRDSNDGRSPDDWNPIEVEREPVTVYESYQRRYSENLRKCLLVKAIHSKGVLLDYEIVSTIPYFVYSPIPDSHKFYGLSLAELGFHIQKTNSGIKRGISDNIFGTNNPKWLANLRAIVNQAALVDNRPGAIIDVNAPDPQMAIKPLPAPQLSAATFQFLETMESEKGSRSGVSKMSQGMDPAVISKQNSSELFSQVQNTSNRRIKVMASHLAEFLTKVLCESFNLAVRNETTHALEINGQMVTIDPSALGERDHMSIDVALTPDEEMQEAQMLLSLDQHITMNPNDPTMGGLYGPKQRYKLFSRVLQLANINTPFLLDPDSPEYQQQQLQMAEQQKQQAEAQETQNQFNNEIAARQVVVLERQEDSRDGRLRLDILKQQNQAISDTNKQDHQEEIDDGEQLLKMRKQDHDIAQDNQKLKLEKLTTEAKAAKDFAAADRSEETGVQKIASEKR
nr:portal protein [uncultured Mediterranean phage uvMED]